MIELPHIRIVGLTGMSGAGKSTVCGLFAESGFEVADCDKIARRTAENPAFLRELSERFPEKLTDAEGRLDREITAKTVFSDKDKNRLYCHIIFPYIVNAVIKEIKLRKKDIAVDAPTLFEAGLDIICTEVVSVIAPVEICVNRIISRDGITPEMAQKRLLSQHNADFFRERSDFIIENNGELEQLVNSAKSVIKTLKGG